ncbi:unnamed protein product, partial [Ixodes pacificus]
VVVADPSQENARDILKLAESFYVHRAPLRIGIVFAVNPNMSVTGYQDAGVAMLNAFNFISQDRVPYEGLSFITDVYAAGREGVTAEIVIKQFKTKYPGEDLDLVFGEDSDYDTGRKLAWEFINKTGIGAGPQALLNGVLLKQSHLNADMFEEAVLTEIMKQTPNIQRSIYKGDLNDSQDVLDFLMEQPNIMPRLNQKILSPGANYLDITGRVVVGLSLEDFAALTMSDMVSTFASHLLYLYPKEKTRYYPLTAWVVGDFDTPSGRLLLSSALEHFMETNEMRVGVIFNPSEAEGRQERSVNRAVWTALESLPSDEAASFIRKLLKEKNYDDFLAGKRAAEEFLPPNSKPEAFKKALEDCDGAFLGWHSSFARLALKLGPTEQAVVINGRVIGPLEDGEEFNSDDFNLMERYSMSTYGTKIKEVIAEEGAEPSELDRYVQKSNINIRTLCAYPSADEAYSQPSRRTRKINLETHPPDFARNKLGKHGILVNQRLSNVVKSETCGHFLKQQCSAYEYIKHIAGQSQFLNRFELTRSMKYPSLYYCKPTVVVFLFNKSKVNILATKCILFLLNFLLWCYKTTNARTRVERLCAIEPLCVLFVNGLPLTGLSKIINAHKKCMSFCRTLCVLNNQVFLLCQSPFYCIWRAAKKRCFSMHSLRNAFRLCHQFRLLRNSDEAAVHAVSHYHFSVMSFLNWLLSSKMLHCLFHICRGFFDGSIVGERPKTDDEEQEDRINIFSLASGHLYERLLRIMMLSVLKNTKTPVKFWFLKNYLSPTFKDVLPHMAKEYGFDYELVQYKWPRWLNQQTEKQRIIWGYKILFLDVLFPLDVKKIIFVDADQVVRADMKELRDLDLGGAPYGYTPFCDSRQDMEGYRFWKSGYWASHLGGRRYHISALYVVDLKRFRRIAAGDRLRGQYQGLSQDPNSLSNLDQDLPNNMIHQVAIKSLPQEWLWCETWCDDDSKKQAKTIDLCNNPKTKEPKLVSAARIISEWKDYDEELKQFIERYEKGAAKATLTEGARPADVKPDDGESATV